MKYVLLITGDEAEWQTRGPEEMEIVLGAHERLRSSLEEAGRYVHSHRLRPKAEAITIRHRGPDLVATDGPFVESKEHLGGFYLIEAGSIDEAIESARLLRIDLPSEAIEVRPAMTGAEWRGPRRGKQLFTILLVADQDRLARQNPGDVFPVVDHHYELSLELAAQGRFVSSRSLMPGAAAQTLRVGAGGPLRTDGPFAESKELIAGYFVVACDTRDDAVAIGRELAFGLEAVEVRPVWDMSD